MKISSCKAKGRKAVKQVVELLYKYWPGGRPGDLRIPTGSRPGEDIHLSPAARQYYPFVVEIKCQEKLDIWSALQQAENHLQTTEKTSQPLTPLVFFKRNHSPLFVSLKAEDFLKLIRPLSAENESTLVLPSKQMAEASFTASLSE